MATMRKRRKKRGNHYFTKDHQEAIIEYASTKDIKRRTELYIEYIGPVFDEMVDKIIYTYKFTTLPNIDCLKEECKVWLTTILDKFDPEKGSKAFSYFSVITKNWFIHKIKKTATRVKREVNLDDIVREPTLDRMVVYNTYEEDREIEEFNNHLRSEINKWGEENLKENERKVLEAIKVLFDSVDDIEIFNKKAIYLYLREITGLNTKQVVNNLNKIRARYKGFKRKWDEDDL